MAHQHTEDLVKTLQYMHANVLHCDVTLVVEGQTYHAHKVILAARSTYFSELFITERHKADIHLHSLNKKQVKLLIW